jgi:hypothetical protein
MRTLLAAVLLLSVAPMIEAADLQLRMSVSPSSTVQVGQPLMMRFTVTNPGPDASPDAIVLISFDDLPRPASFGCPYIIAVSRPAGGHHSWHQLLFADIAAGATETCDVVLALQRPGDHVFSGRVLTSGDPNPANDEAQLVVTGFAVDAPIPSLGPVAARALAALVLLIGLATLLRPRREPT